MNLRTCIAAAAMAAFVGLLPVAALAAEPSISIYTPGGAVPQENVSVGAEISDPDGDIVYISMKITTPTNSVYFTDNSSPDGFFDTLWISLYLSHAGSYQVEVTVRDSQNNEYSSSTSFDAEYWWG